MSRFRPSALRARLVSMSIILLLRSSLIPGSLLEAQDKPVNRCGEPCQRRLYRGLKLTQTSVDNSNPTDKPETTEALKRYAGEQGLWDTQKAELEKTGKGVEGHGCLSNKCGCALPRNIKWTKDEEKNKGDDSVTDKERVAFAGGEVTFTFSFSYSGSKVVDGKCVPLPGQSGAVRAPVSQSSLEQPLPPGAIFAAATVEPETRIEVEQPGYALVATADVVTAKRVEKGDRLDASTTPSIAFDDGTGLLIKTAKIAGPGLAATVGLMALLGHHDHPAALPVQNGSTTMYVGSDKPFTTPAISIDNTLKTPDTTQAVFLNPRGEKTGQLSTYSGLHPQAGSNLAVTTLDGSGAVIQQSKVEGGALDTSATVSFDRPSYKAGEHGTLQIQVGNYEQGIAATRFGGAAGLKQETIKIMPLSDVKGLPAELPYGEHTLKFQTTHPGQARVAVYMPRAVPPKKIDDPGNNKALKQAGDVFQGWLGQFTQ